ncbi:endonuclease/exonuclease/phosphatase family protein [Nocardiopsis potens]|uniref:endonuclease/exonuclease/phosphatase family protein n=1 Tax=Nocardiopsis potens TaxID=1246458 RepID=UPI00034B3701|nr:endonuclease/exonuclease/phosphatase family protein [Nocardiopsis potens]
MTETTPTRIRVLSWNIRYDAWTPSRREAVHALLAAQAPDVVCLQEIPSDDPARARDIAEHLGLAARIAPAPNGLHTAVLVPPGWEEVAWDVKYASALWHGAGALTVRAPSWPVPLTVVSAHLVPHDVDAAVGEARLLIGRVQRQGCPGILVGDINHAPWMGPEPDWSRVPAHNRSARTVLDPARPEELVADRRVGLVLRRGGLVDAAELHHARTGDDAVLEATGHYGRLRVDQVHLYRLEGALLGYERLPLTLDSAGDPVESDHHPIVVDLDLGRVADTAVHAWH